MDSIQFKQSILPLSRKLYAIAYRVMGNEEDAKDMVQETFLKLWNKRTELDGIQNIEAYCISTVRNVCLDSLRKGQLETIELNHEYPPPIDDASAYEVVERSDEMKHIRQLIGQLPEQQRTVLTMRDLLDYSYEEIEQSTGLKSNNVRVILSRARSTLREQINRLLNNGE